jgi:hypothetical protein
VYCTSQDNQRLPGLKQRSQFPDFQMTKVTAHTKAFQVIEGRNIPDWKKFLSVKENKQALINFFGDFIVKFNCVLYKSGQSKTSWSETTFTISGFPNQPAM